ncbi:MAG: exonuclease SbcCD subunit D [Oscillospiraceae bacterium]|nr:exonuclease SbcCD subunit D [Oscillospiraceae bacterium]
MKFLHLSDLHIGKNVNGFSMIDEQRHAFEQIIDYIKTERPDAIIIAGDVYDRVVPGVEAVRVFDDFITELAGFDIAVLLVSGNHDSPERLNYASRLLSDKSIFLCGIFDGTLKKVILSDEYGEVNFWLLPFIKPSSVYGLFGERKIAGYDDAVSAALETAGIDYNLRNVLVSHQFYIDIKSGITPARSESEFNPVGGLDAIDCALLENFDYVALGHLHKAQKIGVDYIRYAGSPVKYSFSEWRHEKSITLVELKEKNDINITELPVKPVHDMREIKGEIAVLTSDEISLLADKEDYLRVILTDEGEIIDPMGKIRNVYPNVMSLDFENTRTSIDISQITANPKQADQLSPYDLFGEFFLDMNGSLMSREQAEIIRDILDYSNGTEGVII